MQSSLTPVATIHTGFSQKFGIPRQSGLVENLIGEIHFEKEFAHPDAIRGITEFSHLWLLWGFSLAGQASPALTVAPPRLGGKERRGVFATRSPFRPNSIGLSSVRLAEVRYGSHGEPILIVAGADLLDGTPIYDIKPYLPYTDCHPQARGGFGQAHEKDRIRVCFPQSLQALLPPDTAAAVHELLALDPRAAYNKKEDYVYGMNYAGYDIRFTVKQDLLTVMDVVSSSDPDWKNVK